MSKDLKGRVYCVLGALTMTALLHLGTRVLEAHAFETYLWTFWPVVLGGSAVFLLRRTTSE